MKKKLTFLAYSSFIFIAVMFTVPNVVLIEIASAFNVETYKIGYALSFFTIGTSAATFFSGYILQRFDLKKFLFASYAVIITGLAGIFFSKVLYAYEAFLLVAGTGTGVLIATSNYILVKIYDDTERRYKISMLNFFYGFGSIICPILISQLMAFSIDWREFYLLLIGAVIFFGITLFTSDTSIVKHEDTGEKSGNSHFTSAVIFTGLALFFYVISEVIFTTWVITYMRETLSWNLKGASNILSVFWVFMAAGRILSGLMADKIKLNIYIASSMISTLVLLLVFLSSKEIWLLYAISGALGLAYSALYPSILTYGTMQIENIPPFMVTFFITMGAAGSLAAFPISGFIKQHMNLYSVIFSSIVFMIIAMTLIFPIFIKKSLTKRK